MSDTQAPVVVAPQDLVAQAPAAGEDVQEVLNQFRETLGAVKSGRSTPGSPQDKEPATIEEAPVTEQAVASAEALVSIKDEEQEAGVTAPANVTEEQLEEEVTVTETDVGSSVADDLVIPDVPLIVEAPIVAATAATEEVGESSKAKDGGADENVLARGAAMLGKVSIAKMFIVSALALLVLKNVRHSYLMRYNDKKLFKASKAGDLFEVQTYLADGACPTAQDEFGNSALIAAAKEGHLEIIQLLLACSKTHVDINAATKDGQTALIVAAMKGYASIVERLVIAGANVNAQDQSGRTALVWAQLRGFPRVVAFLKGMHYKFTRVLPEWSPSTPTKEELPPQATVFHSKVRMAPSTGMTIGALFAGTALAFLAMHTGGRGASAAPSGPAAARVAASKAAQRAHAARHGSHRAAAGAGGRGGGKTSSSSGRALLGAGPQHNRPATTSKAR